MIDERILACSIMHSNKKLDKTMVIVACEDLTVHALKYKSSKYLFSTTGRVEQIFTYCDDNNMVIVTLLKLFLEKYKTVHRIIEVNIFKSILLLIFLLKLFVLLGTCK